MHTISEIQKKLKEFNNFAQSTSNKSEYQTKWRKLFNLPLSSESANSFVSYYRDMRSKTRKQGGGGGSAMGAPLDYATAPGLNIQSYGRFPIEAGTDLSSIRNLDVYFRDSLTSDCGVKDSSLKVPADMGSNQVGGRRRVASRKRQRKPRTLKSGKGRRGGRKTMRQRGGNLLESVTARTPFVHNSSAPPNMLQQASHAWAGNSQFPSSDPSDHTWTLRTNGVNGIINPGIVSYVPNDVGRIANPVPWMTSN